jgi:RES domain-containing protein
LPDIDLYLALDALGPALLDGVFYRHTAVHRDPLSGVGARIKGGRWNPPGTETLYLARPIATCRAEFFRMAEGQGKGTESFLPRRVHTIAVTGLEVIDLRREEALAAVGLDMNSLTGEWSPCQAVGDATDTLGMGGLLVPSATQTGEVLAVFVRHAHHGELSVVRSESADDPSWSSIDGVGDETHVETGD